MSAGLLHRIDTCLGRRGRAKEAWIITTVELYVRNAKAQGPCALSFPGVELRRFEPGLLLYILCKMNCAFGPDFDAGGFFRELRPKQDI